ncbi:hypothetical protein, conserved [Leishmania tarentolae]|uniref:Sulfhydryl oxidase n=1 Tax=Leishmania tarentolae TaxID=5689 RepID=A0A640KSV8_LEITA|nr:hypothetical protein, conserved [Leishmania tarentolae]
MLFVTLRHAVMYACAWVCLSRSRSFPSAIGETATFFSRYALCVCVCASLIILSPPDQLLPPSPASMNSIAANTTRSLVSLIREPAHQTSGRLSLTTTSRRTSSVWTSHSISIPFSPSEPARSPLPDNSVHTATASACCVFFSRVCFPVLPREACGVGGAVSILAFLVACFSRLSNPPLPLSMAQIHQLAVAALCVCSLGVLYSLGVAARDSEPRSLFRDALEVVDIENTRLKELHEFAHVCPWILVTYLDSCGHCRYSAPLVARIAQETLGDHGDALNEVTVAALNCEVNMDDCRELGVVGVPSFYFLFPPGMPVNATTLVPVVANKKLIDKGSVEEKPIMMTRTLMGRGANPKSHFNTARNLWVGASRNLWGATDKERCLHMRTYLRNSKESDTAGADTGRDRHATGAANFVEDTTFHVTDVANAFFETLYHEVALGGLESAARRRALFQFLRIVQQRLPGLGADVLLYYMNASRGPNDSQSSGAAFSSFSIGDWQNLVLSAGIPYKGTPRHLSWRTCRGSSWRYRGFPCGMWLLYHSLTVNTAGGAGNNNAEVLPIILEYARHFFACDSCLAHFLRFQPDDTDPVLQLWRFHNEVNRRLAMPGEGEDPLVPKKIFPTVEQCPTCLYTDVAGKEEDRFVETEVSKYLRSRYKWNPTELHEGTVKVTGSTTKRSANNPRDHTEVYYNSLSLDVLLTIILVFMAVVLGMVYVLRRRHLSIAKRRRPIAPFRGRV